MTPGKSLNGHYIHCDHHIEQLLNSIGKNSHKPNPKIGILNLFLKVGEKLLDINECHYHTVYLVTTTGNKTIKICHARKN